MPQIRTIRLATALALVALLGCSSDEASRPEQPLALTGDWEVVDIELAPARCVRNDSFEAIVAHGRNHVIIADGTVHVLNERGVGFRSEFVAPYVDDGDLDIDGVRYDVELTHTALTLRRTAVTIRLEPRDAVADPDGWIRELEQTRVGNTAFGATGDLANDGNHIWIAGGPAGRELLKLDLLTLTTFPVDAEDLAPTAIDFRSGAIRANDGTDSTVHIVDPDTGTVLGTSIPLGNAISTIIHDGTLLWCVSNEGGRVVLYNPTLDLAVGSMEIGDGECVSGGTYANGVLYLANRGVVTEFAIGFNGTARTLDPIGAFHVPDHDILGITRGGSFFWVNVHDVAADAMRLYRLRESDGAGRNSM